MGYGVSFIIPAHNEEAVLRPTLDGLAAAASELHEPFEIIVVDDGSTDRTEAIARGCGVRTVAVSVRQIAAARNAGARATAGELFIFIDADTRVDAAVVAAAVQAMRSGAVGGGAGVHFDQPVPWWARP